MGQPRNAPPATDELPGRIRTTADLIAFPAVGNLITADATKDLRKTQAEFDAQAARIEADMRERFGERGADAARTMSAIFSGMMVRK